MDLFPARRGRRDADHAAGGVTRADPGDVESNRGNVRDIANKLVAVGYVMVPARSNEPPFDFPGDDLVYLAE